MYNINLKTPPRCHLIPRDEAKQKANTENILGLYMLADRTDRKWLIRANYNERGDGGVFYCRAYLFWRIGSRTGYELITARPSNLPPHGHRYLQYPAILQRPNGANSCCSYPGFSDLRPQVRRKCRCAYAEWATDIRRLQSSELGRIVGAQYPD